MNITVINNKIESVLRCINRIKSKNVENVEDFISDYDRQDVVVLNLERAIQICVDIAAHILADYPDIKSSVMSDTFYNLAELHIIPKELASRLAKAVGFRNLAVHEYKEIDYSQVFDIVHHGVGDIIAFTEEIKKNIQVH
ncbi:MAG: DUF86 domain-containing protein [Spirochaetales bacterium]|nr:DUF86 domain-containing protein [Spirochaetales bacterium]